MNVLRLLGATVLIMCGIFLTAVVGDILFPYDPVEVTIDPEMIMYPEISPDSDDWAETAWALGVDPDSLTWDQFFEHERELK